MGTTNKVKKVDEIIPPIMVIPKGDHKVEDCIVKGTKPSIVVIEVNMIGVNLLSLPTLIASNNSIPSLLS